MVNPLTCLTFLLFSLPLFSQNPPVERFGVEQGLSQGFVTCLLQDREGFIWMGTQNGLNRYDGLRFKTFTSDPFDPFSLPGNHIYGLGEAGDYLLVGTFGNGASLFHKKTERFFRLPFAGLKDTVQTPAPGKSAVLDRLPGSAVHYLEPDGEGTLWMNLRWHADDEKWICRMLAPPDFWERLPACAGRERHQMLAQVKFECWQKDGYGIGKLQDGKTIFQLNRAKLSAWRGGKWQPLPAPAEMLTDLICYIQADPAHGFGWLTRKWELWQSGGMAEGWQLHVNNAAGNGKILVEGSDDPSIDFKKGANSASINYNGSALSVPDILNVGTLNATNFSPANLAVSSKLAVGQADVDPTFTFKVTGQSKMQGLRITLPGIPAYQTCNGCALYGNSGVVYPWPGSNNSPNQSGIYVEGMAVDAASYITQSDRRIKTNFFRPESLSGLNLLKQLKVTDYQYLDKRNGGKTVKGFIAQEVKEVLPDAINYSAGFIPSILSTPLAATMLNGQLRIEMPNPHDLKKGDKVRIFSPGSQEEVTVLEVASETAFLIENWSKTTENLFVYGKEIPDFHGIDFDQVTALNVSATQELARRVEQLEKENATLRQENGGLRTEMDGIEKRLLKLENGSAGTAQK